MQLFSLPLQLPLQQSTSFLFLACQLQSVHLETFVSLFSPQLLGTEVACRDLAPSLPSMKTDTLDKQVRCCGCWCPPSVLAALTTLGCVLALASGKILTSAFARSFALRLYTKQECWAMSLSGHSSLQVVWRWLSIGAQGSEPLLGIGAGLFCVVIGPSAMNGFPKMTRDTNTPWALLISMGKAHDNLTL